MAVDDKTLDELLKDCKTPKDITGENGLLNTLTKRLLEKALEGEMNNHLGYDKHSKTGYNTGNSRNGKSSKKVKTSTGEIEVSVPRDRNGDFEPQIIEKHQRRFDGFDKQIISMYGRGMTTRDIKSHLKEMYGVDVSADMISNATDLVMDDVIEWQNRPLENIYPIIYLDCIFIKSREDGRVQNKAVYLIIGIKIDGLRDVLGIWIEETEGAKFWLKVVSELKNRGVEDILIACVDGLKGFPEAINAVFPKTRIQLCIVHAVRSSLRFVSYKDRKELAADLKLVYSAPNIEYAEKCMNDFKEKWDKKYPLISKAWENNWEKLMTFMDYPDNIRKIIYTTNPIESVNSRLRKVTKNRPSFPNDKSVEKILYLAIQNITKKWTMPIRDWGAAINQMGIIFEGRVLI